MEKFSRHTSLAKADTMMVNLVNRGKKQQYVWCCRSFEEILSMFYQQLRRLHNVYIICKSFPENFNREWSESNSTQVRVINSSKDEFYVRISIFEFSKIRQVFASQFIQCKQFLPITLIDTRASKHICKDF